MLGVVLQTHQVHDVDEPNLQVRQMNPQQIDRGQRLECRNVAGRGDHHIGISAQHLRAGPLPDTQAAGAVGHGLLHGQEVGGGLLARYDDVDVLARAQAVIVGRQQRVGVRRQVHPHDVGALVHHVVDEARVLVGEPVVVLPPDVTGQQVVQARDRPPPRDVVGHLEPLGVLIEHRIDDVDERLVAVEQPVPAGQQVTLQPALALMLGEHLDHPAHPREVLVHLGADQLGVPLLVGPVEHGLQPVGRGLVGSEDPEIGGIQPDHLGQPLTQHPGGLGDRGPRGGYVDGELPEVGQPEILEQQTAVGVGGVAHPQLPRGSQLGDVRQQRAVVVEQLLGAIGGQPVRQHTQVLGGVAGIGQRHLVRAPGPRGLLAVDVVRTGPALRGAEYDHRPGRPRVIPTGRPRLDVGDVVQHVVQQRREAPVRIGVRVVRRGGVGGVVGDLEEIRLVAVADHQGPQFVLGDAGQHRRIGDLVAVEVQDRQHHAVLGGVAEFVGVPSGGQRTGFGFAVADHGRHQQVGVVERGPVGMRQRVAELTPLVDRAGSLGCHVRGNTAGERELPEQPAHPLGVGGDVGVDLAVGAVQVCVGHQAGAAVSRTGEVDRGLLAFLDHPVEVGVEEVQPRRGAPVTEQARFDVLAGQRRAQQRVVQQVDLPDRQIVRRPPPAVDSADHVVAQRRALDSPPRGGRDGISIVGSRCGHLSIQPRRERVPNL